MASWKSIRDKKPGKQAAKARAVLAASAKDFSEEERLAQLPKWARTRISELALEIDRLSSAMRLIREQSRALDQLVIAADDGDDIAAEEG